MNNSLAQHIFFFAIFVLAWVLMYNVLAPFLVPVLLALVFSVFFQKWHERLSHKTGNKSVAAVLSVLMVVCIILIPVSIISFLVFNEARDLYISLASDSAGSLYRTAENSIQQFAERLIPGIQVDISAYVQSALAWLINNTGMLFSSAITLVLDVFILLIALYYLFRDGKEWRSYLIRLSPLDSSDDEQLMKRIELTINSVIRGSLIIAIIQGLLAALGFAIFGIANPALWGVVIAIASLIPGVGTGLINIPTVIILFATGDQFAAIGYLIWAVAIVGLVDNFLGPKLIEQKVKVHPFLILLSVLGGLAFFGPTGFLAGPILLVVAIELLKLYPKFSSNGNAATSTPRQ
jgi:predicted PurR-regulated permease PerM